jgi:2-oxo-4-hydroxy-4-carboxy-5-ureidoimidazoline decarboxylase
VSLEEFNAASDEAVTATLLACCDVPSWAAAVRARRPYADEHALLRVADEAARALGPEDVDRALAAHPRIGERAEGAGRSASWSRQEQSGVADGTRQALLEGNRTYEDRFGRVFLIRAAGRTPDEMLAELERRLAHDDATEVVEACDQLAQIALLRLRADVTDEGTAP